MTNPGLSLLRAERLSASQRNLPARGWRRIGNLSEQAMTRYAACRIGVEVGGTFTDLVLVTQAGTPSHTLHWSTVDQCCHEKFCHTGEACPWQGTGAGAHGRNGSGPSPRNKSVG
jgi:hypothetical protein